MAARRNSAAVVVESPVTPFDVLISLIEMDSTEDNPTALDDVALDLAELPETVRPVLDRLKSAGIIAEEKGETFHLIMDVSKSSAAQVLSEYLDEAPTATLAKPEPVKPKRTRRTQAQMAEAREKETEKNRYMAKLAEGQDAVMAQAPVKDEAPLFRPAPNALPKGTKIVLSDGTEATVIADEVITVKAQPKVTFGFERTIKAIEERIPNLSRDRESYVPDTLDVPTEIPEGVNENTWHMAYSATSTNERDTWTARLFWIKRAYAQHTAALAA